MSLVVTIFWILSVAGLFSLIFDKRFELTCPPAIITGVLFLYVFGFLRHISWGYYSSFILIIAFNIYLVVLLARKKEEKILKFIKNFFTPGLFIFILFCIFIYFLNRFTGFRYTDEFAHWGPMARETIRYDSFYSIPDAYIHQHKDYPPFYTLLEVLFCHFGGGKFVESFCYKGLNAFMLSLFLPVFTLFKKKDKKNIIPILLLTVCMILIPLSAYGLNYVEDGSFIYTSLYVDWHMAAFVAYTFFIILIFDNDLFSYINLSLCFITLLLMKQMGVPFYLLTMLYFVVKQIIINKDYKGILKKIFWLIIIPAAFFVSWKFIINYYGAAANAQFQISKININSLIDIFINKKDMYETGIYDTFVNALNERAIVSVPFDITYVPYCLLITLFITVLSLFNRKNRNSLLSLGLVYLFGAFAYCFTLLIMYMFVFDTFEGPRLASFGRYLGTYLYLGNVLMIMLFGYVTGKSDKLIKKFTVAVLTICFTLSSFNFSDAKHLIPEDYYLGVTDNPEYQRVKYIMETYCKDSKTVILEEYTSGFDINMTLDYDLGPSRLYTWLIVDLHSEYLQHITPDNWNEFLSYFDYLFLQYPDDYFIDNYWDSSEDLLRYGLYKITPSDEGVELEYLGAFEEY